MPARHPGTVPDFLYGTAFSAAGGAIPGSSSGAHIHVGQASPRLTVRR